MLEFAQTQLTPVTEVFNTVSFDVFMVAGLVFVLFCLGLWKGKTALATLFFSLVVAAFIFSAFPFTQLFSTFGDSNVTMALTRLGVFLVFVVISYLLLSRISYAYTSYTSIGRWFDSGLLAVSASALCLTFFFSPLKLTPLYTFGPFFSGIFGPTYLFYWLIGGFIAFFISVKR